MITMSYVSFHDISGIACDDGPAWGVDVECHRISDLEHRAGEAVDERACELKACILDTNRSPTADDGRVPVVALAGRLAAVARMLFMMRFCLMSR